MVGVGFTAQLATQILAHAGLAHAFTSAGNRSVRA
jgi:hypothetical protein